MLINQAFKYELNLNNVQRTLVFRHAGTARFAWNWALDRRIELFKTKEGQGRFTNAIEQHREWNAWKKENAPWVYEASKCAPQEAFRDLDKAFKAFRRGLKGSRQVGFPNFKKKGEHDSFRLTGSIKVKEMEIQLPRLGSIRTKEETSVDGRILAATVSREADRWYVSITVERDRPDPKPVDGDSIGIDLGLNCFAVQSNGEHVRSPKPLQQSLKRLQRLSKVHSRKQKGSKNRVKSAMELARLHRKVKNRRKDFLHKFSTRLTKTKSVIVVEDLNVGGMVRNHKLARHISDAGWSEFRRMLDYKTKWYGSQLVIADRFYPSSKTCSSCGTVMPKMPLSVREWTCPECSTVHDRDMNAALNLERFATASSAES